MKNALIDGQRVRARPGLRATCPGCGQSVIAKCGSILAWHWAHESADCDPWSEPETAWHLNWKDKFPDAQTEVVMGPHRADVVTPRFIIELQHSSISPEEIRAREQFYKRMVWIFDASDYVDNFEFRKRDGFHSFRWKHPRKSLWACTKPVYLDFGDERIFNLRKVHQKLPCGGWGEFVEQHRLIRQLAGK